MTYNNSTSIEIGNIIDPRVFDTCEYTLTFQTAIQSYCNQWKEYTLNSHDIYIYFIGLIILTSIVGIFFNFKFKKTMFITDIFKEVFKYKFTDNQIILLKRFNFYEFNVTFNLIETIKDTFHYAIIFRIIQVYFINYLYL